MLSYVNHGSRTNVNTKAHAKVTTHQIVEISKKDHALVDSTANGVITQNEMSPRPTSSLKQMRILKQKQTSERRTC